MTGFFFISCKNPSADVDSGKTHKRSWQEKHHTVVSTAYNLVCDATPLFLQLCSLLAGAFIFLFDCFEGLQAAAAWICHRSLL